MKTLGRAICIFRGDGDGGDRRVLGSFPSGLNKPQELHGVRREGVNACRVPELDIVANVWCLRNIQEHFT